MQLLAESFYSDDFVGGANDVEGGYKVFQTSRKVMKEGEFNLRKWHTNTMVLQVKMSFECLKIDQVYEIKINPVCCEPPI